MTVPILESKVWRMVVPTNLLDFDISMHTVTDESPTSVVTQQNTRTSTIGSNNHSFETTYVDEVPIDEYDRMQDCNGDRVGSNSSRDEKLMNDIREGVDLQEDDEMVDDKSSIQQESVQQSMKKVRIASQWVQYPVMDDDDSSSTVIILTPPSCDEYKQGQQQNKNDTSTYMKQNRRDRNSNKEDVKSYETTTVKTTTYTPTSKFVTSLKDFGRSLPLNTTDFFNNPKTNNSNQSNSSELQHVVAQQEDDDEDDGYDMKFGFQQAMESIDTSSFLQAITVCGANMECVGTVSNEIDKTFGQKVTEHINKKMELKTRTNVTTSVAERQSSPRNAIDRHVPITSPAYKETKYVTETTRYKDDDESWLEPSPTNDNDDDDTFWEDQQIRRLGSWATYATAGTEVTYATAGTEVTDESLSLLPGSSHSMDTTLTPYNIRQSKGGGDSVDDGSYSNSKQDNNATTAASTTMYTLYDDAGNPIDPKLIYRRRKKAKQILKNIQHSNNRRKKISFAYPPISSMKICPRMEPEEIQNLFYTEEELDMYEQDRRSTITVDDVEIVAISQSMDDEIDAITGKEMTTVTSTTTIPPNADDKNLSINNNNNNNRNNSSSAADISKTDTITAELAAAAAAAAEQVTPPRQNRKEKTTKMTSKTTTSTTSSSTELKHESVQTKQETIVASPLLPPSIPRPGKSISNNNNTKQVKQSNDTENRVNNSNTTISRNANSNSLSSLTGLIPRPKLKKNVTTGSLTETSITPTADDSIASLSSDTTTTQKQHRSRYGTPILFRQRCGGPEQKLFGTNRNVFQRLTDSRHNSTKKQTKGSNNNSKKTIATTPVKGNRFANNFIPTTTPSTTARSSKVVSTPTTVMTMKQTNDNTTIQETTLPLFESQEQTAVVTPQSSSTSSPPTPQSSSTSPQSSSSSIASPNNDVDDVVLEQVEEATTKKNKRLLKSVQIYLRERSTGAVL